MRLTRRGWGAVAIVALGMAMAWGFGARALNAVVAPVVVGLVAGALLLRRADPPSTSRTKPAPGFPGETRSVDLDVTADLPVTVTDAADEGLRAIGAEGSFAGNGTVSYEVELLARGEHELGPATATYRDPLGLLAESAKDTAMTPVLVYPDVRAVAHGRAFDRLIEEAGTPDRQAFDSLREYVPGDALRDVHWKSSAKRADDELVVTEYAAQDEGGVAVAAEAAPGCADEMAAAAASVAVHLLDANLRVTLTCPGGSVEAGAEEGREAVLELLARAPAGRVGTERRRDADVYVRAADGDVTVRVGGSEYDLETLLDPDWTDAAPAEVVA